MFVERAPSESFVVPPGLSIRHRVVEIACFSDSAESSLFL
jgi:hypothetical protein